MYTGDYASEKTFYTALDHYMQIAAKKGYLQKKTVVSFPEYLGTWLVVAGEKKGVFEAKTVHDAMELMAMSNLVKSKNKIASLTVWPSLGLSFQFIKFIKWEFQQSVFEKIDVFCQILDQKDKIMFVLFFTLAMLEKSLEMKK